MGTAGDSVIVIGYGNPARGDDGLGPAFAEAVASLAIPGVTVRSDFQLTVADAASIAPHDVVVFVDATRDGRVPFALEELEAPDPSPVASHGVSPEAVLGVARNLFRTQTRGFLLAIRGYEFGEFGRGLSAGAEKNLAAAIGHVQQPDAGFPLTPIPG